MIEGANALEIAAEVDLEVDAALRGPEANPTINDATETDADRYERTRRVEAHAQFQKLKYAAQANLGLVSGLPGVRSPAEWAAMLEKAGDEIGNGKFLVRWLGAERYLAPAHVAVLLTLRQNLIADLHRPTAADLMMIDAAIIAYYNTLRVQGWIGNLSLVFEGELFGNEPLSEFHGASIGNRLEEQIRRLAEVIMPLQERAARMMMRSLEGLRPRRNAGRKMKAIPGKERRRAVA